MFRLITIGSLSILLCFALQSPTALAKTTAASTVAQQQSRGTVVYLKRSMRGYGYYFSPTYISCHVDMPCVTIVNGTGRAVLLSGVVRGFVWLEPGQRYGVSFMRGGTHYVSLVRGYTRIPLTVSVDSGYYRGGPACEYDCLRWRYRS